jgi:hypothetical protein
MPTFDCCSLDFLRSVLSGQKFLFTNREIAPIKVPRLKEFQAADIYKMALIDQQVRKYIPEPSCGKEDGARTCSKEYLFNGKWLIFLHSRQQNFLAFATIY